MRIAFFVFPQMAIWVMISDVPVLKYLVLLNILSTMIILTAGNLRPGNIKKKAALRAAFCEQRIEIFQGFNSSLTMPAIILLSAFPASCCEAAAITLPISLIPVAPESRIIAFISGIISSLSSCFGR